LKVKVNLSNKERPNSHFKHKLSFWSQPFQFYHS